MAASFFVEAFPGPRLWCAYLCILQRPASRGMPLGGLPLSPAHPAPASTAAGPHAPAPADIDSRTPAAASAPTSAEDPASTEVAAEIAVAHGPPVAPVASPAPAAHQHAHRDRGGVGEPGAFVVVAIVPFFSLLTSRRRAGLRGLAGPRRPRRDGRFALADDGTLGEQGPRLGLGWRFSSLQPGFDAIEVPDGLEHPGVDRFQLGPGVRLFELALNRHEEPRPLAVVLLSGRGRIRQVDALVEFDGRVCSPVHGF